jgi:lipoyl(octanoyl) transferase
MSAITPAEWSVSQGLVPYPDAVRAMEERVAAIGHGTAPERVWLLEHPPLYTAGTSARDQDLLEVRFPTFKTGRGGQYTYHGPGQRVAYVMLDLDRREKRDVRLFVYDLEQWLIAALARLGVTGERRKGRVGIWVTAPDGRENKIAAIGVRLKRWVSYHGVSLNVSPDLSHYSGIVPCGIADDGLGVTSLAALGIGASLTDTDAALRSAFVEIFGPVAEPAEIRPSVGG